MKKSIISLLLIICLSFNLIPASFFEIDVFAAGTPSSLKFDINWEADTNTYDLRHILNGTKIYYYNSIAEESTYLQLKAVLKDADGNEITDTEVLNGLTWWLGTTEGVTELNGIKIYVPENAKYPTIEMTPDVVDATTRIYAQWTDGETTLKTNVRFRTVGSLGIADFSSGAIADENVFSISSGTGSTAFINNELITRGVSSYSAMWSNITSARALETPLINLNDLTYYNYVNLWVYSKDATGTDIGVMFADSNDAYFRSTFKLDFSGWKLVVLPLSEFSPYAKNGALPSWSNITDFCLSSSGWGCVDATENDYVCFDNIWLDAAYPKYENAYEFEIVNMNKESVITASKATPNSEITKNAAYSAEWGNMTKQTKLVFSNVPRDWSTFEHIEFNIYSEKKTTEAIKINIGTDAHEASGSSYFTIDISIDWEGWKTFTFRTLDLTPQRSAQIDEVTDISFFASGWGLTASSEPRIYIDSIMAYSYPDSYGASIPYKYETRMDYENIKSAVSAMSLGSDNVLVSGEVKTVTEKVKKSEGCFYASATMFSALGFNIPSSVTSKTFDNITYFPVENVLTALNKNYWITDGNMIVIAEQNIISQLKNNSSLTELIHYTTTYKGNITLADEDFDKIAENLKHYYAGTRIESVPSNYTVLSTRVRQYNNAARNFLTSVNTTDSSNPPLTPSGSRTIDKAYNMYATIANAAIAYASPLCTYYKNGDLKEAIIYSLLWIADNYYGEGNMESNRSGNWWTWEIGAPQHLMKALICMYGELTEEQVEKITYPLDYLMPRSFYTMANKTDQAIIVLITAVMQKNSEKVLAVRDSLDSVYRYNEGSGDGFYRDGSFIQHSWVPYISGYGGSLFNSLVPVLMALDDTKAEIINPQSYNIFNWIFDAVQPFIYNGYATAYTSGRNAAKYNSATATSLLLPVARMVDLAENDDLYNLKLFIKRYATDKFLSGSTSVAAGTFSNIYTLYEVINDSSISGSDDYKLTKVFPMMDRVIKNTKDYAVGIAMNSARISTYECINGENMKGWYMSDGMVYVYTADNIKNGIYAKEHLAYMNPYRMPGTTVDKQERAVVSIQGAQSWLSDERFVGGTTIDEELATVAMQLDSYSFYGVDNSSTSNGGLPYFDCDLETKKAWFIFDDEVVCLGTDINSSRDNGVETIVENMKNNLTDAVTVDGETLGTTSTSAITAENASWAHIANTGGYVFPNRDKTLNVQRYTNTYNFTEMWFDHGANPKNDDYAYIILPTKTAFETEDYSQNNDAVILCNNKEVQAAYDKSSNSTGIVFWNAGSYRGITTDKALTTMQKKEDNLLTFSVADPTHDLTSATVTIANPFLVPEKVPENATITKTNAGIEIKYDLTNSKGTTYTVKFRDYSDTYQYQFDSETNKLSISFDVVKPETDSTTLKVVVAKYNSSDKLIMAEFCDIPLTAEEIISSGVETYLNDDEISYIKIFIWNDIIGLIPNAKVGFYKLK